ncbi:MAG: carboxypeptidase regulatory-like domain-containing protein [Chloracidobacterium sp.]|nr:carboxypeptidase regulatory-like domain-containing protein [Chloracidobacterium sp.]
MDDEIEILRSLSAGKLKPRIYGTVYELTRGLYPLRKDYWDERRPMSQVKIVARKQNETFESVSDSRGMFSIANVQNGKYRLEFILPPGYKLGGDYWDESTKEEREKYRNIELNITDTEVPDRLEVETRINGRIIGKVIDVNRKPVGKDVRVSLVSRETAEKEVGDIDYVPAYTDEKGNFEFFGIPPGEYYLGFNLETRPNKNFPYPRTYFPGTSEVSDAKLIVLGKAEKLDAFVLSLPAKVEEVLVKGKVVDSTGRPVKGAVVERYGLYYGEWKEGEPYSMKYIKQPTFEGRVKTNENGEFSLTLLKGNRYRLNPFLPSKNSHKDLLEGAEVDIVVEYNMKPILLFLEKKPD